VCVSARIRVRASEATRVLRRQHLRGGRRRVRNGRRRGCGAGRCRLQCPQCCDAHATVLAVQHRMAARTSPWATPSAVSSFFALISGRPRLCTNAAHEPGLA
jgi:hypothetical protein